MRAYLDQRIQMRNNPDEECKDIYNLFKQHIDTNLATLGNGYVLHQHLTNVVLSNIALLNANVTNMMENDVIFIKLPSLASYHFLVAIKQGAELVTFQKFGRFGRTYMGSVSPQELGTLFHQYFSLIENFQSRTPVPSKNGKNKLTENDIDNYGKIITDIYSQIIGIDNLSERLINYDNTLRRWAELVGPNPNPEQSFDGNLLYRESADEDEEYPHIPLMKADGKMNNEYLEQYEDYITDAAYLSVPIPKTNYLYTIYKYIQHPAGVGVGPRKKFNALRMFKQFAKQHSSEIQSSIRKSSSAKFQTKKRKAPRTKKTKRRRK
jgi:hypothetical protein